MIYDLIIGEKLSSYYNYILDFERFELPEAHTSVEIFKKIHEKLNSVIVDPQYAIPDLSEIMSLVELYGATLLAGEDNLGEVTLTTLRDILDALAYYNIEVFCMLRNDVEDSSTTDIPIRAYLIDAREGYHRTSPALGLGLASRFNSSLSDVVMGFISSKLRLTKEVENNLRIEREVTAYDSLRDMNAGYEYNVTKLLSLIEDRGYRIKIFMGYTT